MIRINDNVISSRALSLLFSHENARTDANWTPHGLRVTFTVITVVLVGKTDDDKNARTIMHRVLQFWRHEVRALGCPALRASAARPHGVARLRAAAPPSDLNSPHEP